jgi:hypothetical protein
MLSIYEMSTRGDDDNRQMADLLLRNVFYERETLDLLVELLKSYRPSWAPREYENCNKKNNKKYFCISCEDSG